MCSSHNIYIGNYLYKPWKAVEINIKELIFFLPLFVCDLNMFSWGKYILQIVFEFHLSDFCSTNIVMHQISDKHLTWSSHCALES